MRGYASREGSESATSHAPRLTDIGELKADALIHDDMAVS
jgi:hypothetical protein